jgi:surface polysaccharide O-acyltransferase-like enzyme
VYDESDFITGLVRFSVPCFLMISGKYLLGNQENSNASKFYKMAYMKLIPPLLVYSLFGLAFSLARAEIGGGSIVNPFVNLMIGRPYYHLWYLFTIAGIYLLIPGIVSIKYSLNRKTYLILGMIGFIASCVSASFCQFKLAWGVHTVACFSSYFILGDILGNLSISTNKKRCAALVCLSVLCLILTGCWETYQNYSQKGSIMNYINASNNFSPTVALGSAALFSSVKYWKVKFDVHRVTKYSMHIYGLHVFVLEVIMKAYEQLASVEVNSVLWVACGTAIVFCASYILSKPMKFCFDKVCKTIKIRSKCSEKAGI